MNGRVSRRIRIGVWLPVLFVVFVHPYARSSTPMLEIILENVPESIHKKLMSAIAISREQEKKDLDERHLKTLHRRAPAQIKTGLQSFGYYKATVKAELERKGDLWIARYVVTLGPPVRYRDVSLEIIGEGRDEPKLRKLIDEIPIREGYIVDHTVYESVKQKLLRTAIDRGYLDAQLSRHEIRVDLERNEARLSLAFDTGPLFYFGIVNFIQNELDPAFLERYLTIRPGQRYSAARLIKSEQALRNSGYFQDVEVRPKLDEMEDNRVPVDVILLSLKPSRYVFGLGYGTDTGARAKAEWERRRVNRRGHRFVSGMTLAQTSQDLSARYMIPIRNPQNDRFSIFTTYLQEQPDTSESELGRIGISRSTVHGNTSWEFLLAFQREDFSVGEQKDTLDFLTPGINVSRVMADDRTSTRRGLRADIGMTLAYDGLLSDFSFAQTHLRAKLIHAIGKRGRVIVRGEAGLTFASEVAVLPASLRFFTGGDQSVRGYGYKELGPIDDQGDVIGGRYLLVGSAEYEHMLSKDWSVAAFVDAGNAFDDFHVPLEKGVGFGVRWHSPVGSVRFDLANAVSKQGTPWRIHFSIGPDL